VGPRAGLDAVEKREKKHCPCRESNSGPPARSLVNVLTELLRRAEFICTRSTVRQEQLKSAGGHVRHNWTHMQRHTSMEDKHVLKFSMPLLFYMPQWFRRPFIADTNLPLHSQCNPQSHKWLFPVTHSICEMHPACSMPHTGFLAQWATWWYTGLIIRVIKSKSMRRAGHVARVGDERCIQRYVRKPERKRPRGRPRRRWKYISLDLRWI